VIAFKIPGQPQGKGRPRASVTAKGGVIMRTPGKTASYEQLIWFAYRQAGGGMMHGDLHMRIVACRQIPGSLSTKKKADLRGRPCRSKPDLDNIIKVLCDALNAVAYKDDSQVVEIAAKKVWGDEPHVWVEIREI
jgi:Holliday junction resolvase RusA-like endonuclease